MLMLFSYSLSWMWNESPHILVLICVRRVTPVHLSRLVLKNIMDFPDIPDNLSCLELTDPPHILYLICVWRLATSAYKPARLGKSFLFGLSRRSGQTYPLVADRADLRPLFLSTAFSS